MIRRALLAVAAVLSFAGAADAQQTRGPFNGNLNGASGLRINGLNAINMSSGSAGQWGVFIGPGAGQYILNNDVQIGYGAVGIGVYSLQSLQSSGAEAICGGPYSCQYATTPYAMTGWGEHVIGYDNCNYCSAFGNDSMRDTVGNTASTAVGAQSQDDGVGGNNTSVGAFSLLGNAGSIIVGGTVTVGDINCVPFTTANPNVSGLPASACYTTRAGDNLAAVATGLANQIAALSVWTPGGGPSPGNGVKVGADYHGITGNTQQVVRFHFPGGNTTGWKIQAGTPTCSGGACTETLTVQDPFAAVDTIGIGFYALTSYGLSGTNTGLIGIGDYSMQNLIGSGNNNTICIGHNCGSGLKATSNSILEGQNVLTSSNYHNYTSTNDVIINTNAYIPTTYTGQRNVIINANAAALTGTAQGNVLIGWNVVPASSGGNWQLNIMDALYGNNNNKGGGGGYGWLGAYCISNNGNASLTVCDGGGTATYGNHLGFLQTTAPTITNGAVDATGSDVAGTVTLSAANPVVTFTKAYQTAPHCVVSSPSGTAFTYAVSTTALTLTGGANGNTATYHCIQ